MAEESILKSTKLSLGVPAEHTAFDTEILMHLNTALSTLNQLGVGPSEGLYVEDDDLEWAALTDGDLTLNDVKSYIHLRVKMLFDPPDTGFVLTAMKEQIKELEWRLMVKKDPEPEVVTTEPPVEEAFRREWVYYGY